MKRGSMTLLHPATAWLTPRQRAHANAGLVHRAEVKSIVSRTVSVQVCWEVPLPGIFGPQVAPQLYMPAYPRMDWGKIIPKPVVLVWAGGSDPGASADLSIFPANLLAG